ncbi:MAG: hypothetical protein AAGK02_05705 [Pseudomonadota bacterium]
MDTLRGTFDSAEPADNSHDWDASEEAIANDLPPDAIGQDERRMQVRAYNHWASLLGERTFPSIEDLEPENLPDFGPNSVVLDFSSGIDDPIVQYMGVKIGAECGAEGEIDRLSDVPSRSLLSRITDHYMQILANQAPIGFEAEFVNQRGIAILYRGILLPFSSNDETIDFIYGVINWKEIADQVTADELLLDLDQALETGDSMADQVEEDEPQKHHADPVTKWADSPAAEEDEASHSDDGVAPLTPALDTDLHGIASDLPMPNFGEYALDDPDEDDEDDELGSYDFASLSDYIEAPAKKALDLESAEFEAADYDLPEDDSVDAPADPVELTEAAVAPLAEDAELYDCLASARELAENARVSEDRSRHALYAAVGRAYDFSLAAQESPESYEDLIAESGLTIQERAPMTPIVKLVFGSDYDKTRLTEYASVLSHAHRIGIERGTLAEFLGTSEGGLKAVVQAERRLRREEAGKTVEPVDSPREALAKKLRALEAMMFEALEAEGPEFALVMVRRSEENGVELLGEIDPDINLIEKAARKLVG